ncbi:MAG: enoyl-CoA hydratase/isomerase family protein [Candidatus Thorarchaeota archaeon]
MTFLSERKNSCLHLTLNRPDRANSLDPPTIVELRRTILEAQSDPDTKLIVLSGAGHRNFTTGIDISAVMHFSIDGIQNLANTAGDIATLLYYGKPSIVAINGRAMGMGVVYSAAADYRLIVEGSFARMPEVDIPAFPGASCIALMARVCGVAWTRRILLLGLPLESADCLHAGIADEMVPSPEALAARTQEVAEALAAKNPTVVKAIKLAVTNSQDLPYMDVVKLESELARFFEWGPEDKRFSELAAAFGMQYQLTGNPDQLLEDFARAQDEN